MENFFSFDRLRPVDWRWQRAFRIVNARRRSLHRDSEDPTVNAAIDLIRALSRVAGNLSAPVLPVELQPLFDAYQIFGNGGQIKSEVEARILARQPDREIATLCGTTPEAIHCYEAAFFDVRCRLRAQDAVQILAVRMPRELVTLEQDLSPAWRLVGYFGGPLVLDLMIPILRDVQQRGIGVLRTAHLDQPDALQLGLRIYLAAHVLPPGSGTTKLLTEMFARYRELTGQENASKSVAALMASLPAADDQHSGDLAGAVQSA